MKKILILEDDQFLVDNILKRLKGKSYQIDTAKSLNQAYIELESNRYDLIIADRMLEDGDSLEVIQYINEVSYPTKILCLTKKSEVKERVNGLNHGADDYLGKPFSFDELTLRIEKLLNVEKRIQDQVISLNDYELIWQKGELKHGNHKVKFRPKEAAILKCLFSYNKAIVSRDMLVSHVWGTREAPTNSTIDVYIRRIRMKLKNLNLSIETVRGFGFRLGC